MNGEFRRGGGGQTIIIRDADTVVKRSGTVILGSGTVVRSTGTVVRLHEKSLDQCTAQTISRVTWVGVFVNIVLAVFKLIGGVFGKSQALLADAAHTISDLVTDGAVLIGVRYWTKPADQQHPHGHAKIETLVTLIIGVMLALVGIGLGYEAVVSITHRFIDVDSAAPAEAGSSTAAWIGFGAAIASLVGKEALYRWTANWGRKVKSSALVANAWHHRSDALSSIPPAVTIAVREIGANRGLDLWYLDPVGAIIVCVMLLHAAWEVTSPSLHALLDAGADHKTCRAMEKIILDTPDVLGAHKIRSRYIGPGAVAVDLHILVDGGLSVTAGHAIASRVKARLMASDLSTVDVVIHVEPIEAEIGAMFDSGENPGPEDAGE